MKTRNLLMISAMAAALSVPKRPCPRNRQVVHLKKIVQYLGASCPFM